MLEEGGSGTTEGVEVTLGADVTGAVTGGGVDPAEAGVVWGVFRTLVGVG